MSDFEVSSPGILLYSRLIISGCFIIPYKYILYHISYSHIYLSYNIIVFWPYRDISHSEIVLKVTVLREEEQRGREERRKWVSLEVHNNAVKECQDAFDELKRNYKKEVAENIPDILWFDMSCICVMARSSRRRKNLKTCREKAQDSEAA